MTFVEYCDIPVSRNDRCQITPSAYPHPPACKIDLTGLLFLSATVDSSIFGRVSQALAIKSDLAESSKLDGWTSAEQAATRHLTSSNLQRISSSQPSRADQVKAWDRGRWLDAFLSLSLTAKNVILVLLVGLASLFVMSTWSSRFGSWSGKFSPFARSPTASTHSKVTDQDFSYITSDDIKRTEEEARATRPPRDTDVLILKRKNISYPIHFSAYSIDDGRLTIGQIKEAAASRIQLPTSSLTRIKLLYNGRNLKDDLSSAREEGLRSDANAEMLVVVDDSVSDYSGSEDEHDDPTIAVTDKKKRKKNKRSNKKKSGVSSNPTSKDVSGYAPHRFDSSSTYLPGTYAPSSRPSGVAVPASATKTPLAAIEKLDALSRHFQTTFVPSCVEFISSPPADATKREFDHKRLTETVLQQVLLKLDAVETEGDDDARQRRKALVRDVQNILSRMDEIIKK